MEAEFDLTCPNCGRTHILPDKASGRTGDCTHCGTQIQIPVMVSHENSPIPTPPPKSRPQYSEAGPIIAIDFGTTRTKVGYWDSDTSTSKVIELGKNMSPFIPSAFYIPVSGTRNILVGDEALDMVHTDPSGVVIGLKKEIHRAGRKRVGSGRPAVGRVDLASHLFRWIRETCEDNVFSGKSITRCKLTVPVAFENQKRDCIRRAAELGGFEEIEILEEPVAAARHWGATSNTDTKQYVIICDIGGGTTDFALLKNGERGFETVPDLIRGGTLRGGNDLDEEIFSKAVQKTEITSDALTSFRSGFLNSIRRVREFFGKSGQINEVSVSGTSLDVTVDSIEECVSEFSEYIANQLRRFVEACRENIADLGEPTVLLAGGGSKIQGLLEQLQEATSFHILSWNHADFAIVMGASIDDSIKSEDSQEPNTPESFMPDDTLTDTSPLPTPVARQIPPPLHQAPTPVAAAVDRSPPALNSVENGSSNVAPVIHTSRSHPQKSSFAWIKYLLLGVFGGLIMAGIIYEISKKNSPLIGIWREPSTGTLMTLREDGTCTVSLLFNGIPIQDFGRYTVHGNRIDFMWQNLGVEPCTFQFTSQDRLRLDDPLESSYWNRQ
tara:strand:+ start:6128 stop:7957 length:1830 start_codon:yes stop_codon:yes gene_type:complete